jgi:hypothetical protein
MSLVALITQGVHRSLAVCFRYRFSARERTRDGENV